MAFSASAGDTYPHILNRAILETMKHNGVLSGLAVTQRAAGANMSVDVATGTYRANRTIATKASVTNVTITAADSTNDRFDIITGNSSGTLTATAGTAAVVPEPPNIPANEILFALIKVGAGVTSIVDANITDMSMDIEVPLLVAQGTGSTTSTTEVELSTTGVIAAQTAGDIYKITIITDKDTSSNQILLLRINDGTTDVDFAISGTTSSARLVYHLFLRQGTITNTQVNLDGWESVNAPATQELDQMNFQGTLQAGWIANTHTISLRGNVDDAGTLGFIFRVERLEL